MRARMPSGRRGRRAPRAPSGRLARRGRPGLPPKGARAGCASSPPGGGAPTLPRVGPLQPSQRVRSRCPTGSVRGPFEPVFVVVRIGGVIRPQGDKETGMSRPLMLATALIAVVVAAVAAVVKGVGPSSASASSHREAPLISEDPSADLTDVYAFRSPDK